ncbi:MAG: tetratricopeptide (TPR) repeat protein [Glaciecola sp.]|jgi:tetratricopeptide (TPR) repeat protein
MKRLVVLSFALMIGAFSFAQKKELRDAEKAINDNNFADAKSMISQVESMMSTMDDKEKAKFYFLKGKALYADGTGSDTDVSEALKSFQLLRDTEKASGKIVYTPNVDEMNTSMTNNFITKAQNALGEKNYSVSYKNFENAYMSSPADTLYLYNAALLATSNQSYDEAISMFSKLQDLGYTGITTDYFATEIESGEEQPFPNDKLRDLSVNIAKSHNNARNVKSESKVGDIAKNIALIYIEKGETDNALSSLEKAKASNPNDFNLIVAEANVRYKLGQMEEYKGLISKALSLEPNNIDLLFNLGVIAAEEKDLEGAKSYYNDAIKIDPTYTRAYMNMAALILDQEQDIINEMNKLGTSSADDKKYNELKESRTQLYKDAIPYLETAFKNEPKNLSAARTLMNIYTQIGDQPNFKLMQAKVDALEEN